MRRAFHKRIWECECICGHKVIFQMRAVYRGHTTCARCGTKLTRKMKDAIGPLTPKILSEREIYRKWAERNE